MSPWWTYEYLLLHQSNSFERRALCVTTFFLRHIQSISIGSNIQCLKQIDYKQIEYIACSVLCNFEDSLHFYVAPSEMRIPHWTSAASMLNILMTFLEGFSCFKKVWCLISREYMIYDNEMLYNIKGRTNYNREGVYFVMGSWCNGNYSSTSNAYTVDWSYIHNQV